jgi:hypothetical protein
MTYLRSKWFGTRSFFLAVLRLDRTMRRVPLLSGSRVVFVPADDDDVVLQPPPPPERIVDARAAVRDALRYPLSGTSVDQLARPGGSATIVVQPPALPLPGAQLDPRPAALAATIEELERCGVAPERQTILVAGGLTRRLGPRELERLLPPRRARSFRGRIVVHDAEDPELTEIAEWRGFPIRAHRALVETDLVAVVGAAETVLDGGPGSLLATCDAATARRAAGASSLLEAAGAPEWHLGLAVERALADKVALIGVSLVLDLPRLTGSFRGYPADDESFERIARSLRRRGVMLLPAFARRDILRRMGRSLVATAAFAGLPSVAHAEALLRGISLRGIRIEEPLDALVVGVPWVGPHLPREPVNPLTSASVVLGLALRLRRDAFPVRPDGTLILAHSFKRSFAQVTQAPYAAMFQGLRTGHGPADLAELERGAALDERAQLQYRAGKACHPLLPYADWAGCAPALGRLGRVVVAGCRDALAARTLGFVPTRGMASALEMAHGVSGGRARVGVLAAPPYPPLLVG